MITYKILKPEITNVSGTVWSTLKASWVFWGVVAVSILTTILSFSIWPLFLILFYFMTAVNKTRNSFWQQFAEINGWQYKGIGDSDNELGIMFKQGNGGGGTDHNIQGSIEGRPFRIFDYQFSVGKEDSQKTYFYTVFAFKFNGSFPNIYLNNKHNSYSISIGEKIPLPLEFEKQFSLSAPLKYEIEALEIFTPDVFVKLLEGGFTHDIEFVDHEVLMFVDGVIDSSEKLEKEFSRALNLEDLFDEKLDKFKFEQIGDIPHQLK